MRIQGHGVAWAAAMAAVLTVGCSSSSSTTDLGTDVPVVDTGVDVPADVPVADVPTTTGKCLQCMKSGIAMRFSKLDVKEPSEPMGLPEFLNAIWEPDINSSRLNVVLRIDSITPPATAGAASLMTATVGSAWHNLNLSDIIAVDSAVVPTEYYFLAEGTSQFNLELKDDCTFRSVDDTGSLAFHPGRVGEGLICSAGMPSIGLSADTIPMAHLVANGRINDDCTAIAEGYLSGCIAQQAACEICSFAQAPDYGNWSRNGNPAAAGTPCEASYCEKACEKYLWANFGGFVRDIGVPLACDFNNSGANNGYLIAGDWEAKAVKFGVEPAK
jgi:hypothetical protein